MKLWIDDLRFPPDPAWTWVKTSDEARQMRQLCRFYGLEEAPSRFAIPDMALVLGGIILYVLGLGALLAFVQ